MMQNKFGFDEEAVDESEAKAKQLAFKEDLYKAQNHFNTSKEKYYADLKLRKQSNVPEEYKEAFDFYKQAKESEDINNQNSEFFQQATNKVFNEEFKGFDFKVGDKKYRFKVDDSQKVKSKQSDLSNFVSKYLDPESGKMTKPLAYHRALFAAENVDNKYSLYTLRIKSLEDLIENKDLREKLGVSLYHTILENNSEKFVMNKYDYAVTLVK